MKKARLVLICTHSTEAEEQISTSIPFGVKVSIGLGSLAA